MKYLMLLTGNEIEPEEGDRDELARSRARIRHWLEEQTAAGLVVGGQELAPTRTATTLRREGDKIVVVDGPFVETKEAIGGFFVIDVPDLDAALALARTWPGLDSRCHALERTEAIELRPLV